MIAKIVLRAVSCNLEGVSFCLNRIKRLFVWKTYKVGLEFNYQCDLGETFAVTVPMEASLVHFLASRV